MTAILLPNGKQQYFTTAGLPAVGYKVATFAAGTSTPQVTWQDALKVAQNTNPIILDGRGEASIFWDGAYKVQLQDASGTPIWTQDNLQSQQNGFTATLVPAVTNTIDLGSSGFSWRNGYFGTNLFVGPDAVPVIDPTGNIGYIKRTAAETAAGVTPTNFVYAPGVVDRYGTNSNPGVTDMGPALNTAITVALTAAGSGLAGVAVRFGAGAYNIATKPVFGAASTNIIPVDIGGAGYGTQLICNFAAGSYLFDMTGKNGWRLHDFLMCGNSAHKNGGVAVDATGSAEGIEWEIENVLSLMPGVGYFLSNTNTGTLRNCLHWPGNNPTLIIPQTVTNSDISHGCYMTGGFVHNVSLYDFICPPNSNYNVTNRGIKIDATTSDGVTIIRPLVQTGSGSNNEVGIDATTSGSIQCLSVIGCYNEGTQIILGSVSASVISASTDGGALGSLLVNAGSRENTFIGIAQAVIQITDPSAWGNAFISCNARTTFSDATEGANLSSQPNQFVGCNLPGAPGGAGVPNLGNTWRKILTFAAAVTPDVYGATWNTIRCSGNITINAPLHPRNGQRVGFTIRNESGGAIVVTWNGYGTPPWTNPLTGQSRSVEFMYDSDFSQWRQLWFSSVDVPN